MIMMPMVRMMMLLIGADAAEQVYGDIDDYVDFYDDAIRGVVGFVQSKKTAIANRGEGGRSKNVGRGRWGTRFL